MDTIVISSAEGTSSGVQKRGMPAANRNATLILGLALLALIIFLGVMMINLQLRLNRMDRVARDPALGEY